MRYSKFGFRKKLRTCSCGGNIWEYEPVGILPKLIKCDRCAREYFK